MPTETATSSGPLTLNVFNRQGESVGTVQVDPAEFGGKINRQLLHDVVVMHLANQRAGTHSTLRRGEVSGSTKKLFSWRNFFLVLDRTAQEIVDTAKNTGADVHGPIPLPTRIERYTVLRSPHIDRKSREQFEIRTHKRLIDILEPTSKTIEALNKGLTLPPGVDIKIKVPPIGGGA